MMEALDTLILNVCICAALSLLAFGDLFAVFSSTIIRDGNRTPLDFVFIGVNSIVSAILIYRFWCKYVKERLLATELDRPLRDLVTREKRRFGFQAAFFGFYILTCFSGIRSSHSSVGIRFLCVIRDLIQFAVVYDIAFETHIMSARFREALAIREMEMGNINEGLIPPLSEASYDPPAAEELPQHLSEMLEFNHQPGLSLVDMDPSMLETSPLSHNMKNSLRTLANQIINDTDARNAAIRAEEDIKRSAAMLASSRDTPFNHVDYVELSS